MRIEKYKLKALDEAIYKSVFLPTCKGIFALISCLFVVWNIFSVVFLCLYGVDKLAVYMKGEKPQIGEWVKYNSAACIICWIIFGLCLLISYIISAYKNELENIKTENKNKIEKLTKELEQT